MLNNGQVRAIAAALLSGALFGAPTIGAAAQDERRASTPTPEQQPKPAAPQSAPPRSPSHEMVFHRALRSLMSDEAPEDVRISEEQRQAIAAIERERMEAFREFTRSHAERLRELRTEIATKRREGDEATVGRLMGELRDIEQARPNAEEYTRRVWGALNEKQREAVWNVVDDNEFESLQRRVQHRLNMTRMTPDTTTQQPGAERPAPASDAGRVELSEETFESVRAVILAPTDAKERSLTPVERMRARILALPDRVATREKREALAAALLRSEDRGARE